MSSESKVISSLMDKPNFSEALRTVSSTLVDAGVLNLTENYIRISISASDNEEDAFVFTIARDPKEILQGLHEALCSCDAENLAGLKSLAKSLSKFVDDISLQDALIYTVAHALVQCYRAKDVDGVKAINMILEKSKSLKGYANDIQLRLLEISSNFSDFDPSIYLSLGESAQVELEAEDEESEVAEEPSSEEKSEIEYVEVAEISPDEDESDNDWDDVKSSN